MRYDGRFANGALQGHGVITLPDGRKYEGTWEKGKMVAGEQAPDIPDLESLTKAQP